MISQAGDWVLLIGLPIYVYILTRSLLATSITFAAGIVPQIVLGSVAGVFVDRWNRKRTLVVANLLLAVALAPLALVRTPDHVWIVYIVIFAETCFEQFTVPAQNALLPALVTEEQLVPANALNSLSSNLSRLVGPALGGVIAGYFGLTGIVVVDAIVFSAGGAVLSGIAPSAAQGNASKANEASNPLANLRREWASGLRVLFSSRTLWVLVATFTISALGEGVFGVLYPVFVYQALHGGATEIGELMSAQAVGGLLGGVVAGWLGARLLSRWSIGLNWLAFGAISIVIYGAPAWLGLVGLDIPVMWVEVGLFVAVGIFWRRGADWLAVAVAGERAGGLPWPSLASWGLRWASSCLWAHSSLEPSATRWASFRCSISRRRVSCLPERWRWRCCRACSIRVRSLQMARLSARLPRRRPPMRNPSNAAWLMQPEPPRAAFPVSRQRAKPRRPMTIGGHENRYSRRAHVLRPYGCAARTIKAPSMQKARSEPSAVMALG